MYKNYYQQFISYDMSVFELKKKYITVNNYIKRE